jgi:membrane protease YdiL (CAAX protease family)
MFIEQAFKGNNTWWRVLITVLICAGIFIVNFVTYLFMSKEQLNQAYEMLDDVPKNLALAINLIPFAFLLGLLFMMVYFLQNRNIISLTTARPKIDFGRILFSFGLVLIVSIFSFAVTYSMDSSFIVWNFDPINFTILLALSLLLFPFQIGFEEYLFRGYLMQQIGIIAKNRWFPLLFTSLIFGLFHSANPEVDKMGYGIMVFYVGTGLLLGIMTLMDDSIELALGFHLGNNLIAALLLTADYSALQTDALFKYTGEENSISVLNEMMVSILFTYPAFLYILSKKYHWTNWKERLTGKISAGYNPNV